MKRNILGLAIISVLLVLSSTVAVQAQNVHRYIVKYREGTQGSLDSLGGRKVGSLELINADLMEFSRSLSQEEIEGVLQSQRDTVQYIEPDYEVEAFGAVIPNDGLFDRQWGLENVGQTGGEQDIDIDAPDAWEIEKGRDQVVIAVLDTGIDYYHPDLHDNLWVNPQETPDNGIDDDRNGIIDDIYGASMIDFSGNPIDENGHGTHVAGIIGAMGNNGEGVSGVNWNARILSVKVLDEEGRGRTSGIIAGIQYIINLRTFQGINVVAINASLGGPHYSEAMYDALIRARSAGILLVAAAGNEGTNIDQIPSYPASYDLDNVFTVAAIDASGLLAEFSNYGRESVDMAAPGEQIVSTYPTYLTPSGYLPYASLSGTSMAAPFVSGIAALLYSQQPNINYRVVTTALFWGAKFVSVPRFQPGTLRGKLVKPAMVSARSALNYLQRNEFDSDGDGVDDNTEEEDRTDPLDRGSYRVYLESPVFAKYNTFLGQYNFLELIASGDEAIQAEVNIFHIDGSVAEGLIVRLDPGQQYHLDVNSYVRKDTYGLVRINFNQSSKARLSGRMSHYRSALGGDGFAFAFARELRNPMRGRTFATSNSMDPQGGPNPVASWAELINLEPTAETFTYSIYNQSGYLLYRREVLVPALGEFDVQAGHEYGQGVYLNEFVPHNPNTNYFASISRYRLNEWGTDYSYAFSIDAVPGTGGEKYIPIFNQQGACWSQTNWIEVANTTTSAVPVTLIFRDADGNALGQEDAIIAPKAQSHFNASALLSPGAHGWVSVTPWHKESIVSQGLVYYHDCQMNVLQTAYALPAQVKHYYKLRGTFNRFLDMDNVVSIINPNQITRYAPGLLEMAYPQETIRFDVRIHQLESALGSINTEEWFDTENYGTLTLQPWYPGHSAVAHNLLTRERPDGRMDFVIPTLLR